MATEKLEKLVHTIILDAGPIIRGEPGVSSLLQRCERIVTTPAVIAEIRDEATRARLTTSLLPFLEQKNPKPECIKIVTEFSRKTGDLAVLSRVDIQLLALSYELECERNGGDWRLRSTPGQKTLNGSPPKPEGQRETMGEALNSEQVAPEETSKSVPINTGELQELGSQTDLGSQAELLAGETGAEIQVATLESEPAPSTSDRPNRSWSSVAVEVPSSKTTYPAEPPPIAEAAQIHQPEPESTTVETFAERLQDAQVSTPSEEDDASDGSDSEGWITPANLKKQQAKDAASATAAAPEPKNIQVVGLNLVAIVIGALTRFRPLSLVTLPCKTFYSR
jgi:RNA-binding protein NOB1